MIMNAFELDSIHAAKSSLESALVSLNQGKPNDRTELDRQIAILRTETEKLIWMISWLIECELNKAQKTQGE